MTEAPVEIVPYDPSWPSRFVEERAVLQRALAVWLAGPIEHVGSTAIPGLSGKPVIDILAAVETLEGSRPAIQEATRLGYCYSPYKPDMEHWFCKPSPAFRTHHLHLVPFGSPMWTGTIAFRNYLREHGAVAAEYEALKQRLAQQYRFDREAYTEAKFPFIERIVNLALEQGYGPGTAGR